jgi:hypothetical protein
VRAGSASEGSPPAALAGSRRAWPAVLGLAARDRVNQVVFVAVLLAVGFGDSILLPFDFTQRISLANWQYFDARYVAFTVAFAIAMAWVITLQVHAMRVVSANARRSSAPRRGGPLGALAAVVSLLPSFLCCSPIVPTLVGLLGLSATTQLRTTGRIEYFFATKQDLLLLASLALVLGSGLWSMRKLVRASCLADDCCATDGGGFEEPDGEAERTQRPREGSARQFDLLSVGAAEERRR